MHEIERFNFVRARDGEAEAIAWAHVTRQIYILAMRQDGKQGRKLHHASLRDYKPLFRQSTKELRAITHQFKEK
jgi:hypothetical protein